MSAPPLGVIGFERWHVKRESDLDLPDNWNYIVFSEHWVGSYDDDGDRIEMFKVNEAPQAYYDFYRHRAAWPK